MWSLTPSRHIWKELNFISQQTLLQKKSESQYLLSTIGPSTYSLLNDFLTPEAPKSKSLAELLEVLLLKHLN